MEFVVLASSLLWMALWLVPWRPWSTRESLEAADKQAEQHLADVTVLVPARNEAAGEPALLARSGTPSSMTVLWPEASRNQGDILGLA